AGPCRVMRGTAGGGGSFGRSGFLPVIPHWSRSIPSSVSPPLRSTQVNRLIKKGSLGTSGAPGRSTGITGTLRLTNSERQPRISSSCQGPRPSLPTSTAEAPVVYPEPVPTRPARPSAPGHLAQLPRSTASGSPIGRFRGCKLLILGEAGADYR